MLYGSRRLPGGGLMNGLGRLAGLLLGGRRRSRNGSFTTNCGASNGLESLLNRGWCS